VATKIIKKCISLIEDIGNVENGSGITLKAAEPKLNTPDKVVEPEPKRTAPFLCPRCGTGFSQTLAFGEDDVACPNCEGH
jgi:DNA-directed RNA polymerase subunit RPC12/RpoP